MFEEVRVLVIGHYNGHYNAYIRNTQLLGHAVLPKLERECGTEYSHLARALGYSSTVNLDSSTVCCAVPGLGAVRLVSGENDPAGAWSYGRLQISNGDAFGGVSEFRFIERLGRKATEVACRTLGFATGAQLLAGTASGLPGLDGVPDSVGTVACTGDEATLADCTFGEAFGFPYEDGEGAAAVLCFNPSGAPGGGPPFAPRREPHT